MRSKHSIRVPEGLWEQAKIKAKSEYVSVTAVIIKALKEYVKE
jgi:predicted HicB family RNase H-like nuclease